MNNWIPKKKLVSFAAILASFSIILYSVSLFIVFREIKKIENFYYSAESESSKKGRIAAIKSVSETNEQSIQSLRNFFIQKGDEVKFIEQIEDLAKASAVKFEINSIDIKANQKDSFGEDVSVKIKTEGSWENTMSFLDRLEKMSFGVYIERVNLDADVPGDWLGSVEFVVFREK